MALPRRITTRDSVRLSDHDPGDTLKIKSKEAALHELGELVLKIAELQATLFAEERRSLLVVLQAMDAAGKDGVINAVFDGINPQGVRVTGFSIPTSHELAHDYLWRVNAACPARGEIGVFNRSHYEDVLVVRVRELVPAKQWKARYGHIRDFEQRLTDEGTTIVKIFLHMSKDKQRERFQDRVDDPAKQWKFRHADLHDRKLWDPFHAAYQDAINETAAKHAPWYIVPADRNWVRNLTVARIVHATLKSMDPQFPAPEDGLEGLIIE